MLEFADRKNHGTFLTVSDIHYYEHGRIGDWYVVLQIFNDEGL
jgi:hypothetical protein